jgi:hypothetical protein
MADAPAIRAAIAKNFTSLDIDAPPTPLRLMNDRRGSSLRVDYRHQQCCCGTITGPLTRYSFANQKWQ